ncbi:flagellar hook-basal body complex protein [Noviherbaspirillum pedocola]|uniref:Flagellar hook-basal body complex protein n=1 Tax=Noviherbaspirillum pedocola TaxID=2801341 RepID=A0A934W7K8_9BURK|nr:flagellar hook-basal body complex protein [Noviherbaspirillum pedocola]MBK4735703.1 flagellar hook-basal body complex protein [Noviherbaspirillum pedocola]
MLDAIFIANTGLQAYSKGLTNISSNVSNLNTAGYKRSALQFQDLLYNEGALAGRTGNGVQAGKPTTIRAQGELRQSGNPTDAAIDGAGYFMLRSDGKTLYTRDGQFEFDAKGKLVAKQSKTPVMVLDATGTLGELDISSLRAIAGTPTATIKLDGILSTGDSDKSHSVTDVSVVSNAGVVSTLSIVFTDQTAPSTSGADHTWGFEIRDAKSATVAKGTLAFGVDGSPEAGYDKFRFTWNPTGASPQDIMLDFGDPGSFAGLTSFSAGATSTAKLQSADGKASGTFTASSYDTDGSVMLAYSNGEKRNVGRLALSWFQDESGLVAQGGGLWRAPADAAAVAGAAQSAVFGKIAGGEIEASNVDLTQQFSELIVVQRAYQACSQVQSTANEMAQQLMDTRRRG